MAELISLNKGMRLQEITEGSDLNVRVRDGRVRVTYRNKGLDIYEAKQTSKGIILTPVSPWSGRTLNVKSWSEAKREVEKRVFRAFSGATQEARFISRRLGL